MSIKKVLSDGKFPVKIWTGDVEEEALKQLHNSAMLPFVFKHVAVMPDVHAGKGSTVGTVLATKGAIVPSFVGVDIGCGMHAVKLDLTPGQKETILSTLPKVRHSIERSIPVGFDYNRKLTEEVQKWEGWGNVPSVVRGDKYLNTVKSQLGSLGGGNHFIELCLDENKDLWVMLHSGSRNIGKTTAERHIEKAQDLMKKYFIDLADPDLAYLVTGTPEFKQYTDDLMWCQAYAMENRNEMMRRVLHSLSYSAGLQGQPIPQLMSVNCHHNYVDVEHHYGENVMVTRKGAVRARQGDMGIIPGSMGTKSYIVKGKGNEESFCSCSHGAGRRMSRSKARKLFTKEDLARETEGVECRKDEGVLDELPSSYKDIDEVMANQSDLVEVVHVLKQVLCVKG